MKYDELEIKSFEGGEIHAVTNRVKKRRRVRVLDIAVLNSVIAVAISSVVLLARVVAAIA